MCVRVRELRCVDTEKKTGKRVVKQGFCVNLVTCKTQPTKPPPPPPPPPAPAPARTSTRVSRTAPCSSVRMSTEITCRHWSHSASRPNRCSNPSRIGTAKNRSRSPSCTAVVSMIWFGTRTASRRREAPDRVRTSIPSRGESMDLACPPYTNTGDFLF